jgi:hypothetical protein
VGPKVPKNDHKKTAPGFNLWQDSLTIKNYSATTKYFLLA